MRYQNFTQPKTITFSSQFPVMTCFIILILKVHNSQSIITHLIKLKFKKSLSLAKRWIFLTIKRTFFERSMCLESRNTEFLVMTQRDARIINLIMWRREIENRSSHRRKSWDEENSEERWNEDARIDMRAVRLRSRIELYRSYSQKCDKYDEL
jgi:hypothetical protein